MRSIILARFKRGKNFEARQTALRKSERQRFDARRQYHQPFWQWENNDYHQRIRLEEERSYPPSSWEICAEIIKKYGVLFIVILALTGGNSQVSAQSPTCSYKLSFAPSQGLVTVYANGVLQDTPDDYTLQWAKSPPTVLRINDVPGKWSVIYNRNGVSRRENWACQ